MATSSLLSQRVVIVGWTLMGIWLAVFFTDVPGLASAFNLPVDPTVSDNPNGAFLETMEYLVKYGYLSISPWKAPGSSDITSAVSNLQSFMDISPTGTVNRKTLETVRTPRCGLKDPVKEMSGQGVDSVKHTRYGPMWNKTALTYKIFKFPRDVKKSQYRGTIERAFRLWGEVTPLSFREVNRKAPADIDIRFYSGFHNDEFPFDGPLGVVSHPVSGNEAGESHVARIDVDADENFTFDSEEGINLLQVIVHQIGHALGLGHSSAHNSIMSPCTKSYKPNFTLTEEDITGIQALYGSPVVPTASIAPAGPRLPSQIGQQHTEPRYLCHERPLDAVAVLAGEIYIFKGNRYWQFRSPNVPVSPSSGSLISDRWPGLPSGLDAVYQRHTDNKAVFIRAGRMWIYDVHPKSRSRSAVSYTQIQLRELGLPRTADMALSSPTWPESTYFIRKGKVWHYSDQTESLMSGPTQVQNLWDGLPSRRMDAGFTYNGDSYFVLDERYWKVDHTSNQVEAGYPRNFHTDFLGC